MGKKNKKIYKTYNKIQKELAKRNQIFDKKIRKAKKWSKNNPFFEGLKNTKKHQKSMFY